MMNTVLSKGNQQIRTAIAALPVRGLISLIYGVLTNQ